MQSRLIRYRALLELLGNVDRSTVHRWVRTGNFPAPLKIRGQCYWDAEQVVAAIQKNARESRLEAKAEVKRRAQATRDVAAMLGEESST